MPDIDYELPALRMKPATLRRLLDEAKAAQEATKIPPLESDPYAVRENKKWPLVQEAASRAHALANYLDGCESGAVLEQPMTHEALVLLAEVLGDLWFWIGVAKSNSDHEIKQLADKASARRKRQPVWPPSAEAERN